MNGSFANLKLVQAKIAEDRKKCNNSGGEAKFTESLYTQYSGGIEGKKKDTALLTTWTENIHSDFLANVRVWVILENRPLLMR